MLIKYENREFICNLAQNTVKTPSKCRFGFFYFEIYGPKLTAVVRSNVYLFPLPMKYILKLKASSHCDKSFENVRDGPYLQFKTG